MPSRNPCSGLSRWWFQKTLLERIFLAVLFVVIIIIAVLCGIMIKPPSDQVINENVCNTTICLNAAAKLLQFINPEIDPCEDFHDFVCGKFLKNAHGDSDLALERTANAKRQRRLLELYTEKIQNSDHKMVKFSKQLFKACMYISIIEQDDLDTINDALKQVGGWPAVENDKWNEENFDWIQTIYKLRELGYTHSVFLDLDVKWNLEREKLLLNIDFSQPFNSKIVEALGWSNKFSYVKIMTETVMLFGAKDYDKVKQEMSDVYEFQTKLNKEKSFYHILPLSVKSLQQSVPNITWESFINRIVGSEGSITQNDIIVVPNPYNLNNWLDIISNATKRVQANYMIWNMVFNALPYLSNQFQGVQSNYMKPQARTRFCMEEIEKRFFPSPIDVIYDRRYLPEQKRKIVENILLDIKSEYIKYISSTDWIQPIDKQRIINKTQAMDILVGKEENYFYDQILDGLDYDMGISKSGTFLSLISQANRNYYTHLYGALNKKISSNYFKYIQSNDRIAKYMEINNNAIFFPTSTIMYSVELEKGIPNYLHYGTIGSLLDCSLLDSKYYDIELFNKYGKLSELTTAEYDKKIDCIQTQTDDYQKKYSNPSLHDDHYMTLPYYKADIIFLKIISRQLAYSAYNNSLKHNNEESKLIGLSYTPQQLLWISGTTHYCIPLKKYSDDYVYNKNRGTIYSDIVTISLHNIPEFARDFNCPVGSRMNPRDKCKI